MKITTLLRKISPVFLFFLLLTAHFAHAQTGRKPDIVTLRNASKLEVLILEVDENIIKYKKLSDPEGPLFTVRKSEIASIQYGNGEVETFEAVLEVPNYYGPAKSNNAPPQSAPPVVTGRTLTFQEEIRTASPERLRAIYKYYKTRSKNGMTLGIVGTATGMLVAAIGTGIVASVTDNNGQLQSYQNERKAATGAFMMLGGFVGSVTCGTIGFVKGGKNGSKATRVKRELASRNEPLTFHLSPGFNPASKAGFLTLSMKF